MMKKIQPPFRFRLDVWKVIMLMGSFKTLAPKSRGLSKKPEIFIFHKKKKNEPALMHFPIFPQNKFNVFTTKYLNVTQCRIKSLPCIENFSRIQINYSSSFFPPLCYYLMDREEVLIRVYYGSSAPQQLLFFGDAECRLPEQLKIAY